MRIIRIVVFFVTILRLVSCNDSIESLTFERDNAPQQREVGGNRKEKFCRKLLSFGVVLGQSWGSLNTQQQKLWIQV